jgi:hypothetical protein
MLWLAMASNAAAAGLTGEWVSIEFSSANPNAGQVYYEFRTNGTFSTSCSGFAVEGQRKFQGTYALKENQLTLTIPDKGSHVFTVTFPTEDTLIMTDEAAGIWTKFQKMIRPEPLPGQPPPIRRE